MATLISVAGLLLASLITSYADGVHIRPVGVAQEGSKENLIDVSGLGGALEFIDYESLEIQLLSSTPLWRVQNRRMSDKLFVGASEDDNIQVSFAVPPLRVKR